MARKKGPLQQIPRSRLNKECFNSDKKDHYGRDCQSRTNSKKKPEDEKAEQEAKHPRWEKNQTSTDKVATARSNLPNKESDDNFYLIG